MHPNTLTVGKVTRYPRTGEPCDTCRTPMSGNVLSLVAVQERFIPQGDGSTAYDGPWFTPLQTYCCPTCARAAPDYLAEKLHIRMTEPGESLVTQCGSCRALVDRTQTHTSMILDRVTCNGGDDDAKTLFDFAAVCPSCATWVEDDDE
ncbi:MAG: hypothetical protein EHM62_06195 [Methylococcus sp.]|nr:MAG: hypothetical protein EHM62_06195 [Methylococcus sp.]